MEPTKDIEEAIVNAPTDDVLDEDMQEYIERMLKEAKAYNQDHFEKEFGLSHEEARDIACTIVAEHCGVSVDKVDKDTVDYCFLYELNLDDLDTRETWLSYSALVNGEIQYVTHPLEQGVQTLISLK